MKRKPFKISAKMQRFVDEYLVDLNGAAAARRAGYKNRQSAVELMVRPEIQAAINQAKTERAARLRIEQDDVVRPLWDAYTADPNDLVDYRRTCCRYCYGAGYRYQRTAGEMEREREAHAAATTKAHDEGKEVPPPFDEKGGTGWDPRRDPNPECPECFGDGHGEVFIHDTRKLSIEQRAQLAGVERSKEGIKVKALDKVAVGTLLMRHMGLLNDKLLVQRPKAIIKDMTGRKPKDDQQ